MSKTPAEIQHGACVVTGGGSGLGRAMARELAYAGLRVAVFGRDQASLEETRASHDGILPIACDISEPVALDAAFAQVRSKIGPVSMLINNAAVYPRRDIFDESQASFNETLAINLGGSFGASRHALDDMAKTGFGRIVNVASFADIAPLPASAAYSVSKGAARILTRALVADLADRFPNIVITDWLPGMLATKMGIPDGLAPEKAAAWGVKLALMQDPSLNGATFEMGRELLPPKSLKSRLKTALLLQRAPRPREL